MPSVSVVSTMGASSLKSPASIWRGVVFVVLVVGMMAMGRGAWADSCHIHALGEKILGVKAGVEVVGIYEKGSCENVLDGKDELVTTSNHYYFEHHSLGHTGYNYMGRHDYFKENGIDTGRLKGGIVEFGNGTKGIIDGAYDGVGTRANGTIWNELAYIYYNAYDGISSNLVTLNSFAAVASDSRVELKWETASERDNAGFHLWRAASEGRENGDYSNVIKLTDELIPANGSKVGGISYFYTDYEVKSGVTYYYGLEDIDDFGNSKFHWEFIDSATLGD
ncbi:hypothetical protein QUF54_03920 [Candidatus Marithioploca araucensis]|uniref:Uncharacterized protein n=1 Tax=Candidatus Marithioploca araucensis TaxID=70273 RepID=A0ABT7VS36_9GAMM|nr:hypothetical protein [Candidatus Marithioploca araucensis]